MGTSFTPPASIFRWLEPARPISLSFHTPAARSSTPSSSSHFPTGPPYISHWGERLYFTSAGFYTPRASVPIPNHISSGRAATLHRRKFPCRTSSRTQTLPISIEFRIRPAKASFSHQLGLPHPHSFILYTMLFDVV